MAWYATPRVAVIAADVLYYQNDDGGYPLNIDIIAHLAEGSIDHRQRHHHRAIYLALMYRGPAIRLPEAFNAPDYLFAAISGQRRVAQIIPARRWRIRSTSPSTTARLSTCALLRDIVNRAVRTQYAFTDDARAAGRRPRCRPGSIASSGPDRRTGQDWLVRNTTKSRRSRRTRAYELVSNSGSGRAAA
jgi:hypothetical protein